MSPALCEPDNIEGFVDDLLRIKWVMDSNIRPIVVLEDGILISAQDRGLYPCLRVFNENMVKSVEPLLYSSQDIVTLVHAILQEASEISDFTGVGEIVLSSVLAHELITNCTTIERKKEFEKLLVFTAFYNYYEKNKKGALLHLLGNRDAMSSEIELDVSLAMVGCDMLENIKIDYKDEIFGSYDSLLLSFGSDKLYQLVGCDFSLKLALYVRALELIIENGGSIHWDSFEIGSEMLNSLNKNQAMYGGKYSAAVFESIARVLIDKPKEEVKVFCKSLTDNTPRKYKDFIAYRTHITKGNLGLRLMFGKTATKKIRLTNIGVKGELEIHW
ncbi:TPA: hypothetical protein ACSTJY_003065 [Serratia fonticola]